LANDLPEDIGMNEMIKELEKLMESGEMDNVFGGLDEVMSGLISKDLLYAPLKELSAKVIFLSFFNCAVSCVDQIKYNCYIKG
jgi:hypothetical protein